MDQRYRPLFTPWKIRDVTIKNRIVVCPMGGTSLFGWMEPHHFDRTAADFFLKLAKNNAGLVIPGIAPIRNLLGGRWLYENKRMFQKLKVYMEEFHKTGARLFVQLTAGFGRSFAITDQMVMLIRHKVIGGLMKPILNVERLLAAPSALPNRWDETITSRPLSKKEIAMMIEGFARTALLLKEAGVDGVEIHAVHEGYLLDQFTLSYTNKRDDEYGGSFTNRFRFPKEIVRAIKERCGEDFPVSLRYSVVSKTKSFGHGAMPGEVFTEIGRNMEESIKAAKYLEACGYDMLNADNGTYDAWYWAHPPMYMPLNCNLDDCIELRKAVSIPVVCAGRMEPLTAAAAIQKGEIDGMGVARQFLCDPEWVSKLIEERIEDIRPCICCHNACMPLSHHKGVANSATLSDTMHMARCALNPETMQGHKYDLKPTRHPKKVAVIGGGVGGMVAARVLKLRGHDVTIYEKTKALGGVFIAASAFSFKEKDRLYLEWLRKEIRDLHIEVVYETEVKDLNALNADEVIVATGSTPRVPAIIGREKAIEAVRYLNGERTVGERVLIVGGGLTGCEIAYDLALKGKKPFIVEFLDDILKVDGLCMANSSYLRDYFLLHDIPIRVSTMVKEIVDGEAILINGEGQEEKVPVDDVITAIGYISKPVFPRGRHVHVVGDAWKVGNLRSVVWRAWDVARRI